MTGVDEIGDAAAGLFAGFQGGVVAQVGSDIDIGATSAGRVEGVVAGAGKDRDAADGCDGVAADPQADGRVRQGCIQVVSSALASIVVYANYSRGLAELFKFMVLVTTSTAIIFYIVGALAALKLEREGAIKASPAFVTLTILGFLYSCWAFYGAGLDASLWSIGLTAAGLPIYLAMRRSGPTGREPAPIA